MAICAAGDAQAEPLVTWDAPAGCPDAHDVHDRIERRLVGGARRVIVATVTRDGGRFVAHVELDGGGERTLSAASCDALADAVAVIAARAVNEIVPPLPPPPEPIAVAVAPALVVERVTDSPPPPAEWHAGVRLAADAAVDVMPGLGEGCELAAYVERGAASAELGAALWATSSVAVGLGNVDVGLRTAVARLGWRIGELPVRALAVADFGSMTGTAERMSSGPWLAFGAGLRAWWPIGARVRAVAGVEAEAARERVRFILGDGTLEYEPGRWSVRGSLGVEVAWW